MDNVRFRPLVEFLRRLNDLAPGTRKYRLDGASEKTLHRWFDFGGEPDLSTVLAIGRGCAKWFEGGRNSSLKGEVAQEVRRMAPDTQPGAWTTERDWSEWFKWLWEQCQRPLDFLTWDDTIDDYSSAFLPPRLPVPGSAPFQLRLYSERPVWYLLVWVDGRGRAAPMSESGWVEQTHNGQPDWNRVKFFSLHGERVLPVNRLHPWKLSDEAAAETVVLLACHQEPEDMLKDRIRDAFTRLPGAQAPSAKGKPKSAITTVPPVQLGCLDEIILRDLRRAARVAADGRAFPVLNASPTTDPIQAWHEHLRVQLTPCFDRTVILSFANAGTTGDQP